jgi:hypothetical protein
MVVLFGVTAKRRKFELLAASCLAPLSLGLSEPAVAQACGPLDASGNATCTAGAYSNINYNTGNTALPINLTLLPGVTVNSLAGNGNAVSGFNVGQAAPPPPFAPITITATGTVITGNGGGNQAGLIVQSSGNAFINATSTSVDVTGTGPSNNAIFAITYGNSTEARVFYDAGGTAGLMSSGSNSTGIQADNRGTGNAIIDASGNIKGSVGSASGFTFLGLDAVAGDTTGSGLGGAGNASVTYRGGTIDVQGAGAAGIFASANVGSATNVTLPGTSIIVSQQFPTDIALVGIDAFSSSGATTNIVASTIQISGNPAPNPDYRNNPTGIRATSDTNGAASVIYSGPGITVHGGGGLGIVAVSGSPDAMTRSGSATVDASGASGSIVADGFSAVGILADSGTIRNAIKGRPTTTMTDLVQVTASNVTTPGEFGTAISATGGSGGVTVTTGGSIMGGWQPDVTSVGAYGLRATGVVLGSAGGGNATLNNFGSIGALSDRAVASPLPSFFATPANPSPFPTSNNTSIVNNGTITGFVELVGDNASRIMACSTCGTSLTPQGLASAIRSGWP